MKNYKGNMILIELIIVIFFFSLSQVAILQVFALAQKTNNDGVTLNHALLRAEDTAEVLAGSDDPEASLLALGFRQENDSFVLAVEDGCELYAGILREEQPSGTLVTVTLRALYDGNELFTLPSVVYKGGMTR